MVGSGLRKQLRRAGDLALLQGGINESRDVGFIEEHSQYPFGFFLQCSSYKEPKVGSALSLR